MRRDLDNIVGGIRVRLGEVGDNHFIDTPRFLSGRGSHGIGLDQFTEDRPTRLQIMFEPQHWRRDRPRLRARESHNSNAAAPGRRRDGDDSVVEIHRAIVAGDATTFSISAFSWS